VTRSLTPGGPYITITRNIPTPNYDDSGLINCNTYYYVVSARNAFLESIDSPEANSTPSPPVPNLDLEAETGELIVPMTILEDLSASAGRYIQTSVETSGTATYCITIGENGQYVIWR